MNETVVYMSSCAVDGKGTPDPFMLQELPWLLAHFRRVLLVSYYGVAELTGADVASINQIPVAGSQAAAVRARLRAPFSIDFWRGLWRMIRARQATPKNVIKLLLFAIRGQKLHLWLEGLLRASSEDMVLYAYWMSYEAYAAALSKRKHPNVRMLARGHAFDIDQQRNPMNPYLMKHEIAKEADGLFLISEYAKAQYLRYMAEADLRQKLSVVGIGSRGEAVEMPSLPRAAGDALRIVSCATLTEIKQLPVLIDALARWEGPPVRWLHMGGGPEEDALRGMAQESLGSRPVDWHITGRISNEEVQKIYREQSFDVFINTSRMEGTPVSIMEAMRFGIPVIAPHVGGIPELTDSETGILYGAEEGANGVLKALHAFAAFSPEQVWEMRKAAQKRWNERCRSEALLPLIFGEQSKEIAPMKRV